MKSKLALPALVLMASIALLAAPTAPAKPAPKFSVFGSCDNGKPYKPSRHCHYDKSLLFRGTFVFESHAGKRPVKSCFRIYGKPPLTGGKCAKLAPTAHKAYPFKVSGIRRRFSVKVTWFVKQKDGWQQVGASFMKVRP
ncbi:MAG TPA: hypothetical protein VHA80_11250 [Solirubrobacterales bacterium]|nr:hypothetical protein [Solirubrobacterales bacterium]